VNTDAPTKEALDDNALMVAYANGQSDAFDLLYAKYKQPLYQFILHGCSNSATAAELFQETWMSVINARSNYQDRGTFKAWVYRIARNKLIDFYRATNQQTTVEFDEEAAHSSVTTINTPLNPMELAELHSDRDRVSKALSELPWKQREAVMLKYIAGFSLAEIASEQGDPQETVKSRLRYAYTRLRQQLRATS